jgi:hypothetical protein
MLARLILAEVDRPNNTPGSSARKGGPRSDAALASAARTRMEKSRMRVERAASSRH